MIREWLEGVAPLFKSEMDRTFIFAREREREGDDRSPRSFNLHNPMVLARVRRTVRPKVPRAAKGSP